MPKAKPITKARYLPAWANEPLTFPIDPGEALRRCAFNKLLAERKQLKPAKRPERSTG